MATGRLASTLLTAVLAWVPLAPAQAQPADDWDVQRDPFDRAVIARYKALLARNPHDASALSKLTALYKRYRTVDLLVSEYQAVIDKAPSDGAGHVVLARLVLGRGDAARAEALLRTAEASRPRDAALSLELGNLARNRGDHAVAKRAFEAALTHATDKAPKQRALRALADLALGAGDVVTAKQHLDAFIALDPNNVALRLELGDALLAGKRSDEAIAAYRDAERRLAGDPARKVEVIGRIGQALEAKGDDLAAITEYRRAIAAAPKGYYIEVELTARIIDIHRRRQTLPTLLAEFEAAWPNGRRRHFEWSTLGRLYEETGDPDRALAALRAAVKQAPYELETQQRLIRLLETSGQDAAALAQYEAVVRVAPGEARFQIELAERYWRRGQAKQALAAAQRLERAFTSDPGVLSAVADLYARWGQDALATAAFERLARLEPDDATHLVTLGEQYYQRGDKDRALATWKKLIAKSSAKGHAKLAEVYAEHGMAAEALAQFAKAIALEPKNPDHLRARAMTHELAKNFQAAIADWEAALALVPAPDRGRRREYGRRLVQVIARWGQGEASYRRKWMTAFRGSPPDLDAGHLLVEYYRRRPIAGEPLTTLEALRVLAPTDQDVLVELAKEVRAARRFDDAVALWLALAKLAPAREREAFGQISEIKTDARQDGEAIEWAQKALAKSPSDAAAHVRLAERYVDMQRFADAIVSYEKAVVLDPRNSQSAFALARLHIDAGEPPRAVELYRSVLRAATDDEILTRAGDLAIELEELLGSLGELEKVLSPLAFMMAHKPIYKHLLVELYLRHVPTVAARARSADDAVRRAAGGELTRMGGQALGPLLEALRDDAEAPRRRAIIEVLGALGNPAAAPALIQLAVGPAETVAPGTPARPHSPSGQASWEVRTEALVAAGRLGDSRSLAALRPLIASDEIGLREAATFAVARIATPEVVPLLVRAADDPRDNIAVLAARGLAQFDDPRALTALRTLLADRRRGDLTRATAAWALGQRGAGSAELLAALDDNVAETQRLAAWALSQVTRARPASSVGPLVRAYLRRGDRGRDALRDALANLGGPPAAASRRALGDYPMQANRLSVRALVAALPGTPPLPPGATPAQPGPIVTAHPALIAETIAVALAGQPDVRLAALIALDDGDRLGPNALLVGASLEKVAGLRAAIATAIAPRLLTLMADRTDQEARARAVAVAAKTGSPSLAEAVAQAIQDPDATIRHAALRGVAGWAIDASTTGVPDVVRAAVSTASLAEDWRDRAAAVPARLRLAGADSASLAPLARDPSAYVRAALADGLREIATRHPELMLRLADDPVATVRAAAVPGLGALGSPVARARLAALRDDEAPSVRAAVEALAPP